MIRLETEPLTSVLKMVFPKSNLSINIMIQTSLLREQMQKSGEIREPFIIMIKMEI